uniref:General transcription factor IIH, polypeptide 2 n=1 Tax=Sinocyclocheilus rhinocerous TaxID=307959 RepID=A0A673JAI0_9TELE
MPAHTSKEILVVFSSLTTCDPANIYELIKTLNGLKIRVSVIGLSAEVRVCTILTRETGGSYNVILDESHFKELLMLHVKPPPASSSSECSLIRMGNHTVIVTTFTQLLKVQHLLLLENEPIFKNTSVFSSLQVFTCLACKKVFCVECDLFIHDTLHCCPSCMQTDRTS